MNRRQFLLHGGIAAASLALPWGAWALPSNSQASGSRLLMVLLRGGYDSASLLVPHGFPYYYASRANIAIARPDTINPGSALDIGQGYGIHPASSSLYDLFHAKQAVLVPFSGSQDLSRSHFQAQDVMELGQSPKDKGGLDYNSGFLNRLVAVLQNKNPKVSGISFTGNLTPVFKGNVEIPNINLQGQVHNIADDRQTRMLQALYQENALEDYVKEGIQTRQQVSAVLDMEMQNASRGAAKANGFEKQARSIAALMRDNPAYSIGFVDVGGWDTHVNQGAATGALATNLGNLSNGLSGFADELGNDAWRNTVVVVMSEFGRTFHENGNRGTDHGHGSTMWILGGGISGGKLSGELTDLNEKTLFQNRDLPVLNDYRSVLSHILQRLYGLNPAQLDRIFPGRTNGNFEII
jgi:uncharacterized protein (DUF1501 family)